MTAAQKHQLHVKNGRAGGKARVAAIRKRGSELMRFNALRSNAHQKEIYGCQFVNRAGIERVNKARLEARKRGGQARQEQIREQKLKELLGS